MKKVLILLMMIGCLLVTACSNNTTTNKNKKIDIEKSEINATEMSDKEIKKIFDNPHAAHGGPIEIIGIIDSDGEVKDEHLFYYVDTEYGKIMLAFKDQVVEYNKGDKVHIKGDVSGSHKLKDGTSIPVVDANEIYNAY